MDDLIKLIFSSSGFILFYSMFGKFFRDSLLLSDPLITTFYGIFIGHHFLNILNTHYINSKRIVMHFSQIVLCFQTMALSLKTSRRYLYKNKISIFNLIFVIGITKCIFTFLLLKYSTFYNMSNVWALSASLTPTDPILSTSLFKGKFSSENVPLSIKSLLAVESGINDMLGVFLLDISLSVLREDNFLTGIFNFFFLTVFKKVFISAILGYVLGVLTYNISKFCYKNELVSQENLLLHSMSLTLFCYSIANILDISELICIFVAGIFLNKDGWYTADEENNRISEIIENGFSTSLFLFLGSRIDFYRFDFKMYFLSATVILLIRPLVLIIFYKYIPAIKNKKDAFFIGFFAPVGIGSLYYSLLYDTKVQALTIDFTYCAVFLSILIHGVSLPVYILIRNILDKFNK